MPRISKRADVRYITDYADQSGDDEATLVIPTDLASLSDEELSALRAQADESFDAIYGEGQGLTDEQLSALATLTEGIEALSAEAERREGEQSARDEEAAALASRIRPVENSDDGGEGDESDADDESDGDESDEGETSEGDAAEDSEDEAEAYVVEVTAEVSDEQPEAIAASSARKEMRVNLRGLQSKQSAPTRPSATPKTMLDVVHSADTGKGMTFVNMGEAIDKRLGQFNLSQYEAAARANKHIRQQFGIAVIDKPFDKGLRIESTDREHVETVLARAVDEKRLEGGSLVASGGWCAPSETLYDLFNQGEARDGLISLPEVAVARGGINFTKGPDFSTIFADTGFHYTEDEDEAGDYDGEGGGSKPAYKVECFPFEDVRLDLDGLCITAGLLQSRGYPEVIADTVRKALIAHDHRIAGAVIANLVAGSDAVAMPASQVGATAPVLTAIELQVLHYREKHRLGRGVTLEAVFPMWTHGVVRADLSRRLGVDLFDVSDERINAWFRTRGINPQFVYNWQGIATGSASGAAGRVSYPTDVTFLLYSAGTWIKGGADVITLDTVYDSVLLGTNDYTALFTEEGWLTAKRGIDSRAVTVPICPDGATAAGVAIDCDGSEGEGA